MSANTEYSSCFIFENGSDTIKYGLSHKDKPNFIATDLFNEVSSPSDPKKPVIERGIIKNWNALERIYEQMFKNEFKSEQIQTPVMVITEATNSFVDKEKMCQLLFEKFLVDGINFTNQAVLSLASLGMVNGVVLNSGNSYTSAVSVHDGSPLKHSVELSNVGGRDITEYLKSICNLPDEFKSDNALYKDIKEKYCHLGASSQEASKQAEANIDYELPDGTKIQINAEKINLAANISFQTYIIDYDLPNVQDLLFKSISKAQIDFRKFLYANIVLTGGNTMFRGFGDRFQAELKELVPKTIKVKVTAERNRKYASWVGGTMYAGLNDYKMILKRDYDEVGSRLITKIFP